MGQTCFNFTVENDAALEDSLECLVVRIQLPENASDLLRIAPGNDSTLCCIVDDDSELAISQFRHKKYFFCLCMSKWMATSHDINISAFLHSPSLPPSSPFLPSSLPFLPTLSSLPPIDITIGFTPDSYQVDENAGRVVLNVSLITGLLQRPIEVSFTVTNGTAFSMCVVLIHYIYNVIDKISCTFIVKPFFRSTASIIKRLCIYELWLVYIF